MRGLLVLGAARVARLPVVRDGALLLAGTLLLSAAKAAVLWALARWRGPEIQGSFSLALAGMGFGAVLLALGLDYANSFLVGRHPDQAPAVLRNSLVVALAAALAAPLWALGLVAVFPRALTPGTGYAAGVVLLAAGTACATLQATLQAYALGRQRYGDVMKGSALSALALLVLGGAAVAASPGSLVPVLAAWTVGVGAALVPLAGGWGALRQAAATPTDRGVLRAQLAYGLRTLPGSAARALNLRAGLYLVAIFLSPRELGVYGVMIAIADLFLLVPAALSQAVLGRTAARRHSAADRRATYLLSLAVGAAAAAVAAVAGGPILGAVFGPAYAGSGAVLTLLLLAAGVHAVGLLRLHELLGDGDPLASTHAQLSVVGLTLAGGVVLIPRYHLVGAAACTLGVYVVFTLVLLLRRRPAPGQGTPSPAPTSSLHPVTEP